jgi:hypothetical protein
LAEGAGAVIGVASYSPEIVLFHLDDAPAGEVLPKGSLDVPGADFP